VTEIEESERHFEILFKVLKEEDGFWRFVRGGFWGLVEVWRRKQQRCDHNCFQCRGDRNVDIEVS